MALIDQQEAVQGVNELFSLGDCYCDEYSIVGMLNSLPTQEIIHCKDCRFWKKYKYFNGKPTYAPFCGFNSIFTDDNDFCSRAERRGEEE